ncbi:MAG: RNA polymerase sigma factor [Bacillota bacterium]
MMVLFDELYQEHYKKLYTLAFRITGNKEDAEDVLQNAFLSAYKAFSNFRGESSVYTWLYRIVVNEANRYVDYVEKLPVDRYAEENQISSKDVFDYINSFGEVEDEVMTNNARETCLQLFMNCMPSKYRVVFTLRVILQFSVQETAEMLEISENAVKVHLHRARGLLKSFMDGRCSLINPENPCKCSSWVKYALDSKRDILIEDIKVIRNNEKKVAEEFKTEVEELLSISELYNTLVVPGPYELFKERIKNLMSERRLKLLETE